MESIMLQFSFLQNSLIKVFSNSEEQLSNLARYYADYYVKNTEVTENIDKVRILFHSVERCEVQASFYQVNPKRYQIEHPFKLCIDIIDDYILLKIEQLYIENRIFLHGSGVVYKGVPIVLIGKSKSGKSTATLKLLHMLQETVFLSDDFLALKVNNMFAEVETYRMPLHIRMGSLCYNHLYQTEPMDNEQMYVNVQQLGCVMEASFDLACVFEIKYGEKNMMREVRGAEKINVLMRNLKFYHLRMVRQIPVLSSKIQVYQLEYMEDDFLIQNLMKILHMKEENSFNIFRKTMIRYHIEKKNISHITIQGNSMYPTLIHNQNVSFEYIKPDEIHVGDVILFHRKEHMTVHRVVRIVQDSEERKFFTKGDHNETMDLGYISDGDIIGRIILKGSDLYHEESIEKYM